MANYSQYDGSMSQSTMAQRLLNNGSDYLAIRVGQNEYLFVQGHLDINNNVCSYSGDSWVYDSYSRSLDYNKDDSGTVTLSYPDYVYSSFPQYQSLSVTDVYPRWSFLILSAFLLAFVGFQCIKRRFVL